jgi:hypothetical protein
MNPNSRIICCYLAHTYRKRLFGAVSPASSRYSGSTSFQPLDSAFKAVVACHPCGCGPACCANPEKARPDKNKAEKHTNPAILPIAYGMMDVWINEVPIGLEQNTMHVTQTVTSGLDTAPIPSKNPAFHPSSNPNRKATGQLPHTKGNNKAKTCHLQT